MKSRMLMLASSLLLISGVASIYYASGNILAAMNDRRHAITIDADRPDPTNNGADIFAKGILSGQGEKIADPVFPFELEALILSRTVEVYYVRNQTRYQRTGGETIRARNTFIRNQGRLFIRTGPISQFGADSADDAEPPAFVTRTLDLIPDVAVYATRITLGKFVIEPEAIRPGVFGKQSYPAFSNAELRAFLESSEGAGLQGLMRKLELKGAIVDPDESSAIILYKDGPTIRQDGDVRVSFEALIPQPVGVMAIQKSGTELTRSHDPETEGVALNLLDLQFDEYASFEDYLKDPLYSHVNYEDLYLFGGGGVLLFLMGAVGLLFSFSGKRFLP
ncbi:MAG: hypothetical protein JNM27_00095 [Leptospirales bacterium]|nr:hypothetical protein [Leptospirales bacterium]